MTYREELESAIVKQHGCATKHVETVDVTEVFQGRGRWRGSVGVFLIDGHPQAARCFAWGERDSTGAWDVTTVLAIPPVVSAETAVRAGFAARKA